MLTWAVAWGCALARPPGLTGVLCSVGLRPLRTALLSLEYRHFFPKARRPEQEAEGAGQHSLSTLQLKLLETRLRIIYSQTRASGWGREWTCIGIKRRVLL